MGKQLTKEELIVGGIYTVSGPKFSVAVWTGKTFKGPAVIAGNWELVTDGEYSDGLPMGSTYAIQLLSTGVQEPFDGSNFLAAMVALGLLNDGLYQLKLYQLLGEG